MVKDHRWMEILRVVIRYGPCLRRRPGRLRLFPAHTRTVAGQTRPTVVDRFFDLHLLNPHLPLFGLSHCSSYLFMQESINTAGTNQPFRNINLGSSFIGHLEFGRTHTSAQSLSILQRFHLDRSQDSIFGHVLGGQMLRTPRNRCPQSFTCVSPSCSRGIDPSCLLCSVYSHFSFCRPLLWDRFLAHTYVIRDNLCVSFS